jgi:hypothetical protein
VYVGEDGLVTDERSQPKALLLYLDQNYLSGMVKRKPGFRELEPALRAAVARGAVAAPEAEAHRIESAARPDLPLLELLRELSRGLRLPDPPGARERQLEGCLAVILERDFPERRGRASDRMDVRALALALPRCRLATCDAFMADVVRRSGLHVRFRCELYTGRAPMSTACDSGSSSCRRTRITVRQATRNGVRARRSRWLR